MPTRVTVQRFLDRCRWTGYTSPTVPNTSLTEVKALAADQAGNFWAVGDSISETDIPQYSTFAERGLKCA